ncbi:hypothetical protein J7337_010048 [Fusarium musae]|uniref:FAD-binding domain-containing protein n=1 Tax=Fusarium musae TaxID=1042133 RepID=A0A9P8DC78_9HYPO|nr:hypothetical protein J7337_010048 [Fusarium musae]KAG9499229.1 hypothetical protein J7337_010048 [Fusarium musae]
MAKTHDLIIVGGGPVGLFLGLNLALKGIKVLVIEKAAEIPQSPRALMNFPIVLNEFAKVGILDEVTVAGFKNSEGLCFRTPYSGTNRVLAKIPPGRSSKGSVDYGVQLGQAKLSSIMLRHALQCPSFSIRYNTRYVYHEEDDHLVHVQLDSTAGGETVSAPFMVACDGANSAIPSEGFTWKDWQFVAVNIHYDFSKYGYPAANHIIDPEDWAVIVRASNEKEGLWRVALGIPPDLKPADVEPCVIAKLERLMPGPRPLDYRIDAISPYWAHEKVAQSFRSGRVMLCGDAAHLNNPLTALGLTTGLVDAAVLARVIPLVLLPENMTSARWPKLLDQYATVRRKDFVQRVQKQAIDGKKRIHSLDPKVVHERDDFFNMLNKSPGFANFIASLMMEPLAEDLWPSLLYVTFSISCPLERRLEKNLMKSI